MSITELADIPEDLAAEAAQVPGINTRLRFFLRAEISQHKKRQRQHSEQAKEVVRQAHAEAERLRAAGVTPEQARAEFTTLYQEMMDQIAEKA